jgi:hypothetical protein
MKKIDQLIHTLDEKVDEEIKKDFYPISKKFRKYFAILSTTLLAVLFIIFLVKTAKEGPVQLATIIQSDIEQIEKVLVDIDTTCNILSFNYDNVRINFLTVEKFVGSTIGCLNLAYPGKWHGPYMQRNPTLQGKFYEVMRAKEGFYITPGQGVKLPNGQVIGKDFVITPDTIMTDLLADGGPMNYKGQELATKIEFKIGVWDNVLTQSSTVDKINSGLKEFNDAMPFTQAQTNTNVA